MFEAYSLAIRISLVNGVASGLASMIRQFKTADTAALGLQKRMNEVGRLMLAGGLMAGGGLAIAAALEKTIKPASEITRQMSLLNTLGMKQQDVAAAVAAAWKTSFDVPTTTAAGNLAAFRELRSAFGMGHEREAAAVLPTVGRMDAIQYALTGQHQERVGFDMVKAIELRTGVMTQDALQRNADRMGQAILGMSGTINVSDFHGALKMGKMATQKWSDDFVYGYLPTLMQEMKVNQGGAQTAGTALMSFYQQAHGRMTKAALPMWIAAGLLKPSDIVSNAGGSRQARPGSIAGTDLLESNPYQWVQSYLAPGIAKIMASEHVSAETAINAMFSNRNAAFAAYNMYQKSQQYERDKKTIDQAADPLKAYEMLKKSNPQIAAMALQSRWNDIMAQLGLVIMPQLLEAAKILLPLLIDFGKWMQAHPKDVAKFVSALEALSAILIGSGVATMFVGVAKSFGILFDVLKVGVKIVPFIGAGLAIVGEVVAGVAGVLSAPVWLTGAAIAAGIAAIGVAIWQTFAHWGAIVGWIKSLGDAIGGLFKGISDKAKAAGINLPGIAAGAIGGFEAGGLPGAIAGGVAGGATKQSYVRPAAANAPRVAKVALQVDGRTLGEVMLNHMAGEANKPVSSGSAWDPGMSLTPVGFQYAT